MSECPILDTALALSSNDMLDNSSFTDKVFYRLGPRRYRGLIIYGNGIRPPMAGIGKQFQVEVAIEMKTSDELKRYG